MNTYNPLRLAIAALAIGATGLLAGTLLGSGMDEFARRGLPAANWTEQHQSMDAVFRQFMPVFFNATAMLLILATVLSRGRARWLFGGAALLTVLSIVVTVIVEVPINRTVALWTPGFAPADWMVLRDRWLWNHLVRTISCIVAFWLAAAGLPRMGFQGWNSGRGGRGDRSNERYSCPARNQTY